MMQLIPRCSYNGVMVSFVELTSKRNDCTSPKALFINADAKNEKSNFMEIGRWLTASVCG
jgi:hypothetical protein